MYRETTRREGRDFGVSKYVTIRGACEDGERGMEWVNKVDEQVVIMSAI